jgi:transcriptional regulator with XRE-family HTH domain
MANDPYSSPLAFFTAKLRRLREQAGMTLDDVAKRTNFSVSTISAYETGRRIASPEFAKLADDLFGTGDELAELQKLVENVSLLPWFRERAEVERKAADIREYESYQIPGLLQTEDYARAVMSVGRPKQSPEEIERAVALRMTRQEILDLRDDLPADQMQTPRYWAVIDESALQRTVGNSDIMRIQREHLAYLEDPNSAHYVRDRDDASRYTLIFDHLRASALDDTQTLQLLKGEEI